MLPSLPKPEVKPKFIEFKDYTDDIICIPVATIISFNTVNNGCTDYNPGISLIFEGSIEKNYHFKNRTYRDKVFNVIRSNFSIEVVTEDSEKEYNKFEDEDELPEEEPYVEDMREFGSYCL